MNYKEPRPSRQQIGVVLALLWLSASGSASAADAVPLAVEVKIQLGTISGRIDHLAYDSTRGRLYVAELGNDSVGIVDLRNHRVIRTVAGFDEPQGITYEPSTDTVYVANGGDGSVRIFRAQDFESLGQIDLGDDADNVRVNLAARRVYVGYGNGAIAVIDPTTRARVASIALRGHPEGFQLDPVGTGIYVNVPSTGEIAVAALDGRGQTSSWPTAELHANYPLALDTRNARAIAIFRHPARLEAFDQVSGRRLGGSEVCADADDVFLDPRRNRLYVVCGEGFVDTFDESGGRYTRVGRLKTSGGSRTGLFIPEMDRLLVAIRDVGHEPAAIWVLRPDP